MATKHPDAIALLKQDHRKVEHLFDEFTKARSDRRKQELVQEICTELMIHATIEEEIFYPVLKGRIDRDLLSEAYVEHDGAKVLIAELLEAGVDDPFCDAKMTVLCEEIRHHVKEEERPGDGMFAQARAAGIDMNALADALATRKQTLLAEFRTEGLPTPTTRSFAGAVLQHGAPVA
ncbi:hemerythrin domain-containing protein [Sphingomonas sp. LaA6.9]|uniref:hemerythrin domain-containing protein n=1 Tax=Sphingomonas sp. LaA6.9 TaxID=2919914 RepID=UPI001F4FF20B|nr:hemerythrin domain-containing protein [Sphingomonas sp. LaA6.9]MCJ8158695.1 hemerythrin domain-containing protein [Sphingomonas sp. LaA6.9]